MNRFSNQFWATFLLVISFIASFLINRSQIELLYRLSDAFFITGMIQLIIALSLHVKKLGFFKTVRYAAYKSMHKNSTENSLEFHEFVRDRYSDDPIKKIPVFLIYGLITIIISLIFSFL